MLEPSKLSNPCDPAQFGFSTTAELKDLTEIIGQLRATDAVRFGAGIRHDGYNLFVLGSAGMGKRSLVRQLLQEKAVCENKPADWCYINNFAQPHKPCMLKLPHGRGGELQQHMDRLINYLRSAVPAIFESDEFRAKAKAIQKAFGELQEHALLQLKAEAEARGVGLLQTPDGFVFSPLRGNEVISPDEYAKLPEQERTYIEATIVELQEHLENIFSHLPQWRRERSERMRQLNREMMLMTVVHMLDELRGLYSDLPDVLAYFDAVQEDMVNHVDDFRKQEETVSLSGMSIITHQTFHNYQINVLVTNGKDTGAPILGEDNPTYSNLLGRVEYIAQMGALVTDFMLIKPGALHRANGGYLLLDVRKVMMQPFAWEGLKRALQSRQIRIESPGQMYSLISTVSLEPEPVPLDIKIVLFGDRLFYYLLQEYDPDFNTLFKVAADFEEHIERSNESHLLYARLIATLVRRDALLPFDRDAVARVIEYSARLAGDSGKLSMHMRSITDLLHESGYWARQAGRSVVTADNIQQAIGAQIRRQDRVREQLYEAILRDTLMIDTQGAVTGQVNGLAVIQLGSFVFAQPSRITATTRFGKGELINIEREVKLSGAIHSKGILILSAFLASRYARDQPLSLSASLVFEQSYGMIDGDSASLAELCALLSNLADVPVKQSLAITGSVNQFGQAQAIGMVNEKIEGFFDICVARGLTGDQGVIIPAANVRHLMLRQDVIAAAATGRFHVYAIGTIDQAIALLTGLPAGSIDGDGRYPPGSISCRVAARLGELADIGKSLLQK
ncbi:MAG: AAA family ATPase [Nitrosomonas sp.]|nr:MAG: AAA family ATPase [Nitrosomonas sp.]